MKKFWKKVRVWFFMMWRPLLAFGAVALIVSLVFGFRIGNLTNGVSTPEQEYISSVSSGRELLRHPVYALHKIPVYLLFKLDVERVAFYRLISASFASLAVVSCFFILKEWYTDRIAILGTWLFMTSAWILHTGRLATPEASFLLLMPLLWGAVWLYNTTLRKSAFLVLSVLSGASLYIPGFVWILLVTGIWKRAVIWNELKHVPLWFRIVCALVIITLAVPLIMASFSSPQELLLAAGLPSEIPTFKTFIQNIVSVPAELFVRGPLDAVRWLGRLPMLDVFSTTMLALGLYSIRYHLKLVRIQLIIGSSALLGLLVMLGGPVTMTVIMPAVYILIAGGIAFLLQQWFTVFPRNPIARTIATTLVSISVLIVSFYHINHYFIAWPQTPATKQAFSDSLVK